MKQLENQRLAIKRRGAEFVLDILFPFTYDTPAWAECLMREAGVVWAR